MVIKLLQAIYDPETPLPTTDPEFYKGALEDIQFFGIASQVYYLLKEQNNLDKTPDFFQEALKKEYEEALFNSLLIKSETVKILDGSLRGTGN
ncbi:hypothetical protein QS257_18650 [Terrilactibacillus sp. S3-3]|nr:hypothetical protein QS257_18650 [Terrilactibacillus sp. S3-3]